LILLALGFGLHLLAQDLGLSHAALLKHGGVSVLDAHLGQALGGRLSLHALGDADLALGDAVSGVKLRLGLDDALTGGELGDLLIGLGGLDVHDELLLGCGLGVDDGGALVALGLGDDA